MEIATAESEIRKAKNADSGSSLTANVNNGVVKGRRWNAGEAPCCRHNQEAAMPAKPPRQELENPRMFDRLGRLMNTSARTAPTR